ncbi:hypothetical protein [Lentzea sp. NPDC092896]|uniref:hypothetical protein n=1 Tax=Lentzea sp. NPDC092896 TaxID=3364127 RepID=UPI00381A3CFD
MDPTSILIFIAILLVLLLVEVGRIMVSASKLVQLQTKALEQAEYQSARLHELVAAANLPERPNSTR